jgi:hypothetical protein
MTTNADDEAVLAEAEAIRAKRQRVADMQTTAKDKNAEQQRLEAVEKARGRVAAAKAEVAAAETELKRVVALRDSCYVAALSADDASALANFASDYRATWHEDNEDKYFHEDRGRNESRLYYTKVSYMTDASRDIDLVNRLHAKEFHSPRLYLRLNDEDDSESGDNDGEPPQDICNILKRARIELVLEDILYTYREGDKSYYTEERRTYGYRRST